MLRLLLVLPTVLLLQLHLRMSTCKEVPKAVAFHCGRPALYLTANGWEPDRSKDCLHREKDIVDFCRKHYPHANITNASFSPVIEIHLSGWCHLSHSNCSSSDASTYRIQPWICSVEQPPLSVPPGCQLKEFGGPTYAVCQKSDYWIQLASKNCQRLRQKKDVKPCIKTDSYLHNHFLGVLAVCCPPSQEKIPTPKLDSVKLVHHPTSFPPTLSNETILQVDDSIIIDRNLAIYQDYLNKPETTSPTLTIEVDKSREHQRYNMARKAAHEAYRGRKHTLERELAESESQLSNQDWVQYPEQTQEAENRLHKAFRRKFLALDQEARAAEHDLLLTHQQRVFQSMERRYEAAASAWDKAVRNKPSNLTQLLATMERLHHVVERNRHHLIRQWERLQSSDPVGASSALSYLRERLDDLEVQFNRSLEKVNQVPLLKDAIVDHLAQLSNRNFPQLDAMVKSLRHTKIPEADGVRLPSWDQEAALEAEGLIAKYRHHLPKMDLDKRESKVDPRSPNKRVPSKFLPIEEIANKVAPSKTVPIHAKPSHWQAGSEAQASTPSLVVKSNQREVNPSSIHPAQSESFVQTKSVGTSQPQRLGTTVKWLLSLTTVTVLIIMTLFALRYRIRRARLRRAGYSCTVAEVDEITAASTTSSVDGARDLREDESERLTNWRLNGYENPAYKYPDNVVRFPRA